ncbi:MAG: tetratricopeptide repeat protein [Planctomycetes bacterium]|nr:tetratricopeptide repeat protein [Planctomycetota bacterium]
MRRVGPYEVHEQLGRGGMGAVHRATDARTGEQVALKLLAAADERARRRLALEARALARLRHEHVVALLDVGEERGAPWLAMELVRGRSLQERVDREGPLPPRRAAELVRDVALGLAHAHALGVLHRDLKPANVLLPDGGGPPRLTDFGLAGFSFDLSRSRLTATGTFLGTPGYWAPEQAAGRPDALGTHTDVYGLGALLHACLTGRPPIEGDSLVEVLAATERWRPEPTRADPALDALLLRCLEKDPARRPPSVNAVVRELTRYLAAPPRAAGVPRRRAVVASLALLGLGGAAALTAVVRAPAPTAGAHAPPAALSPARSPTAPDATGTSAALAELLERARARWSEGDLPGALVDCDRVLELAPHHVDALAGRGAVKALLGDHQGALADLDAALHLDPRHVDALESRGIARGRLGDHQGALADLDAALQLDPHHVDALAGRGAVKALLGDRQGALVDLDAALHLDPRHLLSLANRGGVKAQVGDHEGALTDLDAALELDPHQLMTLANRAVVRERLGNLRGALADLDAALQLDPRHVQALALRAAVRERLEDLRGARADLDAALHLDPRHPEALANRGALKERLGDLRGALVDLDAALQLDPRRPEALANRSNVKVLLGDLEGALTDLDHAVELAPRHPDPLTNRGNVKGLIGDLRGALVDLDAALHLDPRHPRAIGNRGVIKERLGDLRGALADLDAALQLDPGDVRLRAIRGRVKALLGDPRGALADLDAALQLDPHHVDALEGRGRARALLDDHQGALTDYQEALRHTSDEARADELRQEVARLRARLAGE